MKDEKNAIEVNNVKKKFRIYSDKGHMLKERVINWKRNQYEDRWVLNGISFSVYKGEAIGLIGHNGCGKSTTLKLLTQIIYPDEGTIELAGRVSSLLELGAGFHPDLSGRENIYINASIFGLSRKEIDNRLEDIIEFSELQEFIDNPVRTYSSGMYMRLAFSVAINVDADILLIDEILAVGDVNFQAKCFNKLMEIKRLGTTIVLVSHSMEQIEQICDRCIWIHEGYVKMDGVSREVNMSYLRYMGHQRIVVSEIEEAENTIDEHVAEDTDAEESISEDMEIPIPTDQEESSKDKSVNKKDNIPTGQVINVGAGVEYKPRVRGTGEARIIYINSYDSAGKKRNVFEVGESICFKIKYKVNKPLYDVLFGVSIFRNDGFRCYGTNSKVDGVFIDQVTTDGEVMITFPNIKLLQGKYYLDVCIATRNDDMVDYLDSVNDFEIYNTIGELGLFRAPCKWGLAHVK